MTYLYGCGFGIAVFERIEAEEFNPNVSLEVGYMFALNKPVCLLKDRTLKTLHTDLVGKLYKTFDPQDPIKTIPDEVTQWLSDKEII
jgi:nucleoside 2-deoxyribosyltransferase